MTSCGLKVSKGDANFGIGKNIHPGLEKAEVTRRLNSLEIGGVKPEISDIAEVPILKILAPDGKTEVEAVEKLSISFSNGSVGRLYLCERVVSTFYFDKMGKLITWMTDC